MATSRRRRGGAPRRGRSGTTQWVGVKFTVVNGVTSPVAVVISDRTLNEYHPCTVVNSELHLMVSSQDTLFNSEAGFGLITVPLTELEVLGTIPDVLSADYDMAERKWMYYWRGILRNRSQNDSYDHYVRLKAQRKLAVDQALVLVYQSNSANAAVFAADVRCLLRLH